MASTRTILSRRATIQNIRKTTRTMEMVSTARFKRVHDAVVAVRPYTQRLARLAQNVARLGVNLDDQPLLKSRDDAPGEVLIVLASNRGLCGGYNAGVLRLARRQLAELAEQGRSADLLAVGKKAINHFRFNRIAIWKHRPQFESRIDYDQVTELANEMMDGFTAGRWRRVRVVYSQFVSTGVQTATVTPLLPLTDLVGAEPTLDVGEVRYDYYPGPTAILDSLLPRTVRLRLFQFFLDAAVSEQVARMTAMRLATDNADQMIRQLTMQYNRARQGTITTELSEIITGAEAME